MTRVWQRILLATLLSVLFLPRDVCAQSVAVRYKEGSSRGFLLLRSETGEIIAHGDLIQSVRGDRVTHRLVFHFYDGSIHDELSVFSQRQVFKLIRHHLVQKGPAFEHPTDLLIDVAAGSITYLASDHGKETRETEHPDLPADVANGMVLTVMKNIPPDAHRTTVSLIVLAPKPRRVKLHIEPEIEEPFLIGKSTLKALRYRVKVEIGGIAGVAAPLLGKQPPDTHVWVLPGAAPAFIRSDGPLAQGGPVWRIDLASPVWP
jgi:hypothetical protein